MTEPCDEPIDAASWPAYFAGELPPEEEEAIEAHLFECPTCAAEGRAVSSMIDGVAALVPPILTDAMLEALDAAGRVARRTGADADSEVRITFEGPSEVVVAELRGDFRGHPRVDVEIRFGSQTVVYRDAPVRADGTAVWLACQSHFPEHYGLSGELLLRPVGEADGLLARYRLEHEVP